MLNKEEQKRTIVFLDEVQYRLEKIKAHVAAKDFSEEKMQQLVECFDKLDILIDKIREDCRKEGRDEKQEKA